MKVRPAPSDPVEVEPRLWADWQGNLGWDIGANCGQSIQHMVSQFEVICAFEPNQDSYTYIVTRGPHAEQIYLYDLAVSDHDGMVNLAAIPRLMETGQLATPGTHGMEWDPSPNWNTIPHVEVHCRTIDSLVSVLGVPDFIKVDTEGHEGLIIDGATELLELGKTDWLIEFHTPGLHMHCLETLVKNRYNVETVRHPHYKPRSHMYYQHGWIRAKAPNGRNANAERRPYTTVRLPE